MLSPAWDDVRLKVTSAAFSIRPVAALVAARFSADGVRVDSRRKKSEDLSVWSFGGKLNVVGCDAISTTP